MSKAGIKNYTVTVYCVQCEFYSGSPRNPGSRTSLTSLSLDERNVHKANFKVGFYTRKRSFRYFATLLSLFRATCVRSFEIVHNFRFSLFLFARFPSGAHQFTKFHSFPQLYSPLATIQRIRRPTLRQSGVLTTIISYPLTRKILDNTNSIYPFQFYYFCKLALDF